MADQKISQLQFNDPLGGSEVTVIVQNGTNRKLPISQLISVGAVFSVNGKTGTVVLNSTDVGAVAIGSNISQLTNDVGYIIGNQPITLSGDVTGSGTTAIAATLAASGVTPGTYPKVTVDAKGRVTVGGSLSASDIPNLDWTKITSGKPTTLAGYGITDAQPLDGDLTAIAALATTGLARRTGSNTWTLDTATYLTANQTVTLSGDITGSGTTAITTAIGANKVTNAMLRQSAGLSVIGRSVNTTGNVADITAVTDGHILRLSGTTLGFGTIPNTSVTMSTGFLLGRTTASAGATENISVGNGLSLAAGALGISASYTGQGSITTLGTITSGTWNAGVISLQYGGTGANLSAPVADRIFFYDQSAGSSAFLTVGTGLSITGTTLSASLTSNPLSQYFAGDGVTTVFTVADANPISIFFVEVGSRFFIEGTHYSKNNTTKQVTFVTAPPSGKNIGIYYFNALNVSSGVNLTNGNATTANGSAVDWGGAATGNIEIYDNAPGTHDIYIGAKSDGSDAVNSSTIYGESLVGIYATTLVDIQAGDIALTGNLAINLGSDATGDFFYRAANGKITRLGIGANGTIITSNGTTPSWQVAPSGALTLTGDVTGSGTGSISTTIANNAVTTAKIINNAVTDAKLRQSTALSIIGNSTNATANVADITASVDNTVFRRSGTSIGFGAIVPGAITVTTGKLLGGVSSVGAEITVSSGLSLSGSNLTSVISIATNEIGKYNGTVMTGTGIISPSAGDFTLGITGSTSGTARTFTAAGSGTDVDIIVAPKGAGRFRVNAGIVSTMAIGSFQEFTLTSNQTSAYAEILAGGDNDLSNGLKLLTAAGSSTHVDGRNIEFVASNAYTLSGNGNGGDLKFTTGVPNGTGRGGAAYFFLGSNGNFAITGTTSGNIFGGGKRIMYLTDAATNPSTNPSTGGYLYSDGSAASKLKWKTPAGDTFDLTLQTREIGTNATMGTATLSGGTIVINNTRITNSTYVWIANNGGVQTNAGAYRVSARTPGSSFTITSTNASDTSSVVWILIEPISGVTPPPSPTAIGTIHSDTFAGDLSKYTVTAGAGSISIVGGKLRLAGGVGNFASHIQFSDASSPFRIAMLENWLISITFVAPTITSSTYGLSLGVRGTMSSGAIDNMVRLSMDTGSPLGSFYFYTAADHASSPNQDVQSSFTLVGGTTYIYEVSRAKNVITATLKSSGGTSLNSQSKTYNITTQASGVWNHNCGRFCIWNHGGTIDISSITISSTALRYTDFLAVGDSNMHGLYAGSNSSRYVEQSAVAKGYQVTINAGISQGVGDVLSYVDQIIYMGSQKVYLNCVSNDIANGVSASTYKSNYEALVSAIKSGISGSTVIHGVPVARGFDFTTLWTNYLTSQFPGENQVDLYTTTKNAGNSSLQSTYNIGDNIHMTTAGNNACAPVLTAKL